MGLPVLLFDQIVWLIDNFLPLLVLIHCLCLHAWVELGVVKACLIGDAVRTDGWDVIVFFIIEPFGLERIKLSRKWILSVVYLCNLASLMLKVVLKPWVLWHGLHWVGCHSISIPSVLCVEVAHLSILMRLSSAKGLELGPLIVFLFSLMGWVLLLIWSKLLFLVITLFDCHLRDKLVWHFSLSAQSIVHLRSLCVGFLVEFGRAKVLAPIFHHLMTKEARDSNCSCTGSLVKFLGHGINCWWSLVIWLCHFGSILQGSRNLSILILTCPVISWLWDLLIWDFQVIFSWRELAWSLHVALRLVSILNLRRAGARNLS